MEALRFSNGPSKRAVQRRMRDSFHAYEESLLSRQDKVSEARTSWSGHWTVAREDQKLGHESMILQLMGELAMRTGTGLRLQISGAMASLRTSTISINLGSIMIDSLGLSRSSDLKGAEVSASAGVNASRRVGDRYYFHEI